MDIKKASVQTLISELRQRGIEVAKIEEAIPVGGGTNNIYIVDNIIRVAWTWVITPFSKKILKKTGGPIVCTWLNPDPIKSDSKVIKLTDVRKE